MLHTGAPFIFKSHGPLLSLSILLSALAHSIWLKCKAENRIWVETHGKRLLPEVSSLLNCHLLEDVSEVSLLLLFIMTSICFPATG